MKYLNIFFWPLTFLIMILLLTDCTKEDPEKLRKEAIILKLVNDINADSLKGYVTWLQNMGSRFALADNRRNVALKIKKRFIRMGFPDTEIDSFMVTRTYGEIAYEQWNYNIIATISGNRSPDSICIIGGHYDDILGTGDPFAIVPGANDNASGVAAALEIARVMKKNNFAPENKIMFIAFGAEELGLWGSRDFAVNPNGFSQKIKFMLNNDMIAYEPSNDPSGWYVNIIDYDNSHNLRIEAEEICTRYTSLNYRNDNTSSGRTDSYPFFINGYKALFFFSSKTDPNYHTLNDLVENCNFDYCREIVRISCALLAVKN